MNCPNCNNPLNPGETFCGVCGSPVQQSSWQSQQPTQQPAWQNQPQQQYQQPTQQYQPPQNQGNAAYQQQYQQYQQPSGFQNQPQPMQYGYQQPAPKKSKTPVIIAIIVAAVLVIGGVVAGIFFLPKLFNNDSGSSGGTSASTVSGSTTGSSHSLLDKDGSVIVTDNAFNADDSETESKIKSKLDDTNAIKQLKDSFDEAVSGMAGVDIDAKGNALVMDISFTIDIPEDSIESVKDSMETTFDGMRSEFSTYISQMKSGAGVNDLIIILVIREKDGTVINAMVFE